MLNVLGSLLLLPWLLAPGPPAAKSDPVKVVFSVSPEAVAPGAEAEVTVRLEPAKGIKLNRYPQVKLQIPAKAGLVGSGEGAIGSTTPPSVEQMSHNYFETIDPLKVRLTVDPAAPRGPHQLDGKLTYYYCVGTSYCAPARIAVKVPLTVR